MAWTSSSCYNKMFGKLAVLALATSSSSSSSSSSPLSSSSLSSMTKPPLRRLQAPHPELTPSERFAMLAGICADQYSIDNDHNRDDTMIHINEWDAYGDFHKNTDESFLRKFEDVVAKEFGVEDAVFMPSGVMGQSIALLIHHEAGNRQDEDEQDSRRSKKLFACHPTSHLLLHENEGFRHLCGFDVKIIRGKNGSGRGLDGEPMIFDHLVYHDGCWDDDISTLVLELPHRELGGKITPWDDIIEMRQFLDDIKKIRKSNKNNGKEVAFHCDGARIFEATTGYDGRSLRELASPFDSIYISFYKGLGGLAGGMLLGDREFCDKARTKLRQFGGNLYTLLPYIVSAWDRYYQNWILPNKKDVINTGTITTTTNNNNNELLSFQEKKDKLVRIVSELSSRDDSDFVAVARFEPTLPQVPMVHLYLRGTVDECNSVRDEILTETNVCLFHRLRPVDPSDVVAKRYGYQSMLELSIGQSNGLVEDEVWISSWQNFSERLVKKARRQE